jgi:antitoxin MazE
MNDRYMRVKIAVQSWGNSLAICIPRAFAQEIRLGKGTEVDLQLKEGTLVISRERKKRCGLSDLLAKVRKTKKHAEADWGRSVGREAW